MQRLTHLIVALLFASSLAFNVQIPTTASAAEDCTGFEEVYPEARGNVVVNVLRQTVVCTDRSHFSIYTDLDSRAAGPEDSGSFEAAGPSFAPSGPTGPAFSPSAAPSFQFQGGTSQGCNADKIGTFAEIAGPHRIEAGGGGFQHVDFYPAPGVPSVSNILPPMEPMIWVGYGSIWEWQCAGYDFVGDATRYASNRLNNGHSGLVVDWRSGSPQVVANVGGVSADAALASAFSGAAQAAVSAPAPAYVAPAPAAPVYSAPAPSYQVPTGYQPASSYAYNYGYQQQQYIPPQSLTPYYPPTYQQPYPQPQGEGCPPAQERTYTTQQDVFLVGPAIAHPWWNNGRPVWGQQQVRVIIRPGEAITLAQAAGKSWSYNQTQACAANLDREFANASQFPVVSTGELRAQGLAR